MDTAEWSGTATELLTKLNLSADFSATKSKFWPHTPSALSGQLRRLAEALRLMGIELDFTATHDGREVQILKTSACTLRSYPEPLVDVIPLGEEEDYDPIR